MKNRVLLGTALLATGLLGGGGLTKAMADDCTDAKCEIMLFTAPPEGEGEEQGPHMKYGDKILVRRFPNGTVEVEAEVGNWTTGGPIAAKIVAVPWEEELVLALEIKVMSTGGDHTDAKEHTLYITRNPHRKGVYRDWWIVFGFDHLGNVHAGHAHMRQ